MEMFVDPAPWPPEPRPPKEQRWPLHPEEMAFGPCDDGETHRVTLQAVVSQRGTRMIWAECFACEARTTYIKHADVRLLFGQEAATVDVVKSNACTYCLGGGCRQCCPTPCGRCRRHLPTHRHHIAPSALFEDADLWPIVPLCEKCHSFWHSVMTPGMRRDPRPPAPHLAAEFYACKEARARIIARNHSFDCDCPQCQVDKAIVAEHYEVYGWHTMPYGFVEPT